MLQSSTGDEVSRDHLQQWGVLLPHEQESWCNGSAVSNDVQPRGFTLRIPSTALSAMRGTYSGWLECRLTLFPSHRFIRNVCGGLVWKVIFWFTRCTWRMGYMVEKASCNSRDLPQKLDLWFEYTLNGVLDRRHKARRKASEHRVNSKSRCADLMIRHLKIIPPRLSRQAVNSRWTEYRFVDVESLCEQISHCSEDRCVGWEGQCSEVIKWGPWAQQQAGERS